MIRYRVTRYRVTRAEPRAHGCVALWGHAIGATGRAAPLGTLPAAIPIVNGIATVGGDSYDLRAVLKAIERARAAVGEELEEIRWE